VAGVAAAAVQAQLAGQRINVSISPDTSTLLDMRDRRLTDLVRASVHYYNTDDELDQAAAAVAGLRRGG